MDPREYHQRACRFLCFGVPPGDVLSLRDAVDWMDWGRALAGRAEIYERAGERALETGHRASAQSLLRTASACFHYAQLQRPHGDAKWTLQARCRRAFARAAPLLDPPAEPLGIPFGEIRMSGYERASSPDAPWVILLNGLDSAK